MQTMNTQPGKEISLEESRFSVWGRLPLARKIFLAFGVLFIFTALIAGVTFNGLRNTQAAYEKALSQGGEIRRISDELQASLLQARLNEKNFFLYWREEGYFNAFNHYVSSYKGHLADMRAQIQRLEGFSNQAAVSFPDDDALQKYTADIAALTQSLDDYEKNFDALVRAYRQKGFDEEADLESRFRLAARKIEVKFFGRAFTGTEIEKLQALFARTRLNEKDYLLTTDSSYINAAEILLPQFKGQIRVTQELAESEKVELLALTDEYFAALKTLSRLDGEIAEYNRALGKSAGEVEAAAARIRGAGEELASREIELARASSARTLTSALFTFIAALGVSVLLAVNFSRQITRPLTLLTRAAKEIVESSYIFYAEVTSADEIGVLAQTINNVSAQLRSALQTLEQRARDLQKQAERLEEASAQSQKRARQMQTIAEIARYISVEKELDKLLPLITETVSKEFGFYHVGIFLLDESGMYANLLAANSRGGQNMLKRRHRLEVGQVGIVGNVTATGSPRIALDVGADAVFFNNPDLPETRSEVALPLKIEGKVIGALDIQSVEVNAFSEQDVEALSVLADQVSIAILNARLLNQLEKSLAEATALQRQYLRETWGKLPSREKIRGYRYAAGGSAPLDDKTDLSAAADQTNRSSVNVPIVLRGEIIGELSIQTQENQRLTPEQVELAQAVAERVAVSAENARLFDETARRAQRERLVADITSKIRSVTDPQGMLRTAVEELQRALNAKRIEIVPGKLETAERSEDGGS